LDAGAWALDVGGGRGDHAAVWADREIRAVVLDPSERMAMAAASHPGVDAVRGVSQAMPFRDRGGMNERRRLRRAMVVTGRQAIEIDVSDGERPFPWHESTRR
jgi:hypothetical protein